MTIRLLFALALFTGLVAFAPAPEAAPTVETELVASAEDDKCVWVGPKRYCY